MLFITLSAAVDSAKQHFNVYSQLAWEWVKRKLDFLDEVDFCFSPFALSPGSLKVSIRNVQFEQFRFEILDSLFRSRMCQLKAKRMGYQS